jgi:hypothetical protein
MLFWVENDIFLWIYLFLPTSSKKMFIFLNHDLSRNPGWETLVQGLREELQIDSNALYV